MPELEDRQAPPRFCAHRPTSSLSASAGTGTASTGRCHHCWCTAAAYTRSAHSHFRSFFSQAREWSEDHEDAELLLVKGGADADKLRRALGNCFERGKEDEFRVESKLGNLGVLRQIVISHDETGVMADWFLDKVVVTPPFGLPVVFRCGK